MQPTARKSDCGCGCNDCGGGVQAYGLASSGLGQYRNITPPKPWTLDVCEAASWRTVHPGCMESTRSATRGRRGSTTDGAATYIDEDGVERDVGDLIGTGACTEYEAFQDACYQLVEEQRDSTGGGDGSGGDGGATGGDGSGGATGGTTGSGGENLLAGFGGVWTVVALLGIGAGVLTYANR